MDSVGLALSKEVSTCFVGEVKIEIDEKKGRKLISQTSRKAGDVILKSTPFCSVVSQDKLTLTCSNCFITQEYCSQKLLRCAGCKSVYYCSSACQRADWDFSTTTTGAKGGHKFECKSIQKIAPHKPTQTIRLMARILRLRKFMASKGVTSLSIDSLHSHKTECPNEKLEVYAQMSKLVVDFLEKDEMELTMSELMELLCKMSCNNFNISDEEMRYIGIGLYPSAALINHSCNPNSVAIFHGDTVVVRAIRDIPENTEVTISYIEIASSNQLRQKELKETFFFDCNCDRCQDTVKDDILQAYKCKNADCDGYVLRALKTCAKCDAVIDIAEYKILEEKGAAAEKEAEQYRVTDASKAFKFYEEAYLVKSQCLYAFNLELLVLADALMNLGIQTQNWSAATKYCKSTIKIYKFVYSPNWPILGLQYFALGKIYWFRQITNKALFALKEAHRILHKTHGSDSESKIMLSLVNLLREAEAEISYKTNA